MPFLTPGKTSNAIDRNALSADRIRRNFQRITQGAVTRTLSVAPGGGLTNTDAGLGVNVDGVTIIINENDQLQATTLTIPQIMARISMGV